MEAHSNWQIVQQVVKHGGQQKILTIDFKNHLWFEHHILIPWVWAGKGSKLESKAFYTQVVRDTPLPFYVRAKPGHRSTYIKAMIKFWHRYFSPQLPFYFRRDLLGGVETVSRTNDWAVVKQHLTANFIQCDDDFLDDLRNIGYNSLFGNKILYGPLQYCNHCCSSDKGIIMEGSSFVLRWEHDGDHEDDLCISKKRRLLAVEVGEPIQIKYARKSELWFDCKCRKCSAGK